MRSNRPQGAASNPRGHHFRAGAIRVLSVTAVAATACTLWAGAASAATKHATTTTISASAAPRWVGAVVKLSATVKGSGRVPTGTVTFKWGTVKLCTGRLSGGKTSCNVRFGRAGTYAVRGFYSGNATHKPSASGRLAVAVRRSPTTTKITNANPGSVLAGHSYTVHLSVTSPAGTPAATGTVVVAPTSPKGLPPSYSCTTTLVGGKGSCNVTPGPGSFGDIFYEATYSGNTAHTGSVSTGTHELIVPETTTTSVSPSTTAHGSVTLTATVIGQAMGNISPSAGGTGTVTFTVTQNGTAMGTCSKAPLTYNGGGANIAKCTQSLTAGSYSVEAAYSGDPNNLPSSVTQPLTVT